MNDDREALATSICSTFDMGHHHHEAFLQPDHCEDGLSDADELLRSLRAQGYSVARSEGPGLDAERLARAVANVRHPLTGEIEDPALLAAEYDRLAVSWVGHQMHNEGTIPEFVALEIRAAVLAIEAEAAAGDEGLDVAAARWAAQAYRVCGVDRRQTDALIKAGLLHLGETRGNTTMRSGRARRAIDGAAYAMAVGTVSGQATMTTRAGGNPSPDISEKQP